MWKVIHQTRAILSKAMVNSILDLCATVLEDGVCLVFTEPRVRTALALSNSRTFPGLFKGTIYKIQGPNKN